MRVNNLPKVVTWKRNGQELNLLFESQGQRPNHYATRPQCRLKYSPCFFNEKWTECMRSLVRQPHASCRWRTERGTAALNWANQKDEIVSWAGLRAEHAAGLHVVHTAAVAFPQHQWYVVLQHSLSDKLSLADREVSSLCVLRPEELCSDRVPRRFEQNWKYTYQWGSTTAMVRHRESSEVNMS